MQQQEQYPDWVDSEKGNCWKAIFAQIDDYDKNYNSLVSSSSLRGVRTYLNRGLTSLYTNGYMSEVDGASQSGLSPSVTRVNFNLTAVVIDTLTAKLASIKAIPQAVTNKGNVKGRKLADDLNHLVKGLFHNKNLSEMINLAYRGAMISRAEYLKVNVENGEVGVDRIRIEEVIVDPADGYYDNPYKIIHRKMIPVHVATKIFPQYKQKIEDLSTTELRQYTTQTFTPMVVIAEAWCKNTYRKKGRHVICINSVDILDEDWDKDYFPIVKCSYNPPVIGYHGQSVVDELSPIQQEIDRILMTMQAIMKIVSVPRVFFDTNSQVNKNHFTNKIGLILEYDGKAGVAPIIHNGASMPPELPAQLEFLIQQGYARVGLTPMDTQGQKPAGLDSGEALKTMTEMKSERWAKLQEMYEYTHVELTNVILNELKGTNIKISILDKNIGLQEMSTKKIPMTKNSYVLQIFPVSSLPTSIPDRIDSVQKMIMMGIIPANMAPELFRMPDLDSLVSMQSAPQKLIDQMLEEMEDEHKYLPPEPYFDLQYALTAALQRYSWGVMNKESPKYLSLLRKFIADTKDLLAQGSGTIPGGVPPPVPPQTQPPVK